MAAWYYAEGREQRGPVDLEEILGLIRKGSVTFETLVWRDGLEEWHEAGTDADLATHFVAPPPLPMESSPKVQGITTAEHKDRPASTIVSRPWPRFWARTIDNLVVAPLLTFGIGVFSVWYAPAFYLKLTSLPEAVFGIAVLPFVGVILALLMSATGTTLGKAIIGVRVPVPPGGNRVGFFLLREFSVWLSGLGLGIPIVALFTQIAQYRRLAEHRPASYDAGAPPIACDPSGFRLGAGVVVAIALLFTNFALRGEYDGTNLSAGVNQYWVNPVTKKTAAIAKTWQASERTTTYGRVFQFTSAELLAEAYLGYEPLPAGRFDNASYAAAIKSAISKDVTLTSEWTPVSVAGLSALRATGKSNTVDGLDVEVTVAARDKSAWRTLVFARGRKVSELPGKDDFVNAMFWTSD